MKFVISRFEHNMDWMKDYPEAEFVIYDRSKFPMKGSIPAKNIGSDIYDKFTYIINHYDNLPDVAIYAKANIFKYINKEEFDALDKTKFQPLLTQYHKTRMPICYYKDGIYWELNNKWYLIPHPARKANELMELLGIADMKYIPFAPGSNYILPRENILKHSKEFYIKLRKYLEWSVYPGECQIMERGLYTLWK